MKTVKKSKGTTEKNFVAKTIDDKLAGGYGMRAASQSPEALLRRTVMSCLLWEKIAYQSGSSVAQQIANMVAQVEPIVAYNVAIEARTIQKLRHVPLYIATVMAELKTHKHLVSSLLPKIILRADELAEFLAIYWKDRRKPISAQIKIGLAEAFKNFNEYHFAKYRGDKNDIKLRDVLRLVHPRPENQERSNLYKAIKENTLKTPDTWEVVLSSGADKKESWERLIGENKLGALAFMRNLRNMTQAGVSKKLINEGFKNINPKWLLPLNFLASAKYAPEYEQQIEALMLRMFDATDKLKGYTVFVVDVSGSMGSKISDESEYSRLDVAKAMAMFAGGVAENFSLYITAGDDYRRIHATKKVAPRRGFGMMDVIANEKHHVGGGGIFTRQCLEYIKEQEGDIIPDRIIVFSDSADCDNVNKIPKPFAKNNYIVDVSAEKYGVNYDGVWDAEVSGWSEHFISFIMAMEGLQIGQAEEE